MPKRLPKDLGRLKPPASGRVEYWDDPDVADGVRGLHLRVTAAGRMTWAVMYRVGGKQVRETLGEYPAVSRVRDARDLAERSLKLVERGVNPVEERRGAAERARRNTVRGAVETYLREQAETLKPKTLHGYRQIFDHDVVPAWGERPISSISQGDVLALVKKKRSGRERQHGTATGGARVQANHVLARLRTFFAWAIRQKLTATDPTADIEATPEVSRERFLDDAEIAAFWAASETAEPAFRDMFRLLLLTAQRVNEVGLMAWNELDLKARTWTIPAARAKNGKAHIVPLSEPAMAILEKVTRVEDRDEVFAIPPAYTARPKAAVAEKMGAPHWVLHDLRRTATTIMARLAVPPHVADRVLNHTGGTIRGVARVYNRFEYLDERKAALEALGRFVTALVDPGAAGNVVELARRA
jgi:integrase